MAFNTHVTGFTAARMYVLATFSVALVSARAWAASATEEITLGTRGDSLHHRAKQSESSLISDSDCFRGLLFLTRRSCVFTLASVIIPTMGLPVTRQRVVAFDSREARLVGAGDEVRDAVPSTSGVTNGARAALGSVRHVATLNPGEARGIMGARRRRWQCWHYGITGITARVTSAFPFLSFSFSFFLFFFFLPEEGSRFLR